MKERDGQHVSEAIWKAPLDEAGEKRHLKNCLSVIEENISLYKKKERDYQREVKELYQSVKRGKVTPTAFWLPGAIFWNTPRMRSEKTELR